MQSETQAVQEGLIDGRVFRWGLFLSLGMILVGAIQLSCYGPSGGSGKKAIIARLPIRQSVSWPPICGNAENVRLYGIGDSVCVRKKKDCLSGVVYVPFNEKFLLDSLEGTTKVCFWLNGRCAKVRTIRKGENLDWGSNLPAHSAMRFWGDPGIVKVEVVSY